MHEYQCARLPQDGVQRLIPLGDRGRQLTAVSMNKNRKLLAFAERGERPHVIVHDVAADKRRKVLRY